MAQKPIVPHTEKPPPPPPPPCKQELLLRGLAVSVEPLVDPPSPAAGATADKAATAAGAAGCDNRSGSKVLLLEPTTISAQAFVLSRLPPRVPPLAPGANGAGAGAGAGGRPPAAVRAISLRGEAWRTLRPSVLQNLPSLVRTWAQVRLFVVCCFIVFCTYRYFVNNTSAVYLKYFYICLAVLSLQKKQK